MSIIGFWFQFCVFFLLVRLPYPPVACSYFYFTQIHLRKCDLCYECIFFSDFRIYLLFLFSGNMKNCFHYEFQRAVGICGFIKKSEEFLKIKNACPNRINYYKTK